MDHLAESGAGSQSFSSPTTRYCSVRGCSKPITHDATTKMCAVCREKHRRYATTKRAKRKLEKAVIHGHAVISAEKIESLGLSSNGITDPGLISSVIRTKVGKPTSRSGPSDAFLGSSSPTSTPSTSAFSPALQSVSTSAPLPGTSWDINNIDPRMFEAQPSSSELAGALTFLPRSAGSQQAMMETESQQVEGPERSESPVVEGEATPGEDSPLQGRKYCSIKGCKTILPPDATYRMCTPCRDRYRNYGITKRAKWKAERIAFDQALERLRAAENDRRLKAGLMPLSDPEELRAWELSIVEGESGLPPEFANILSSSGPNTIANRALNVDQILARLDHVQTAQLHQLLSTKLENKGRALERPSSSSETQETTSLPLAGPISLADTLSTLQNLSLPVANEDGSISEPSSLSLASIISSSLVVEPSLVNVCTVSHCRTILPENHPYRRCDRHRQQNRKHGKIKRVREKIEKDKGPDVTGAEKDDIQADAGVLVEDDSDFESAELARQKNGLKAKERARQLILSRNPSTGKRRMRKTNTNTEGTSLNESTDDEDGVDEAHDADDDVDMGHGDDAEMEHGDDAEMEHGDDAEMEHVDDNNTMPPAPPVAPVDPAEVPQPDSSGSNLVVNEKLKDFSCSLPGCSNLINPYLRWKMCNLCRTLKKELRLEEPSPPDPPSASVLQLSNADGTGIVGSAPSGSSPPRPNCGVDILRLDTAHMETGPAPISYIPSYIPSLHTLPPQSQLKRKTPEDKPASSSSGQKPTSASTTTTTAEPAPKKRRSRKKVKSTEMVSDGDEPKTGPSTSSAPSAAPVRPAYPYPPPPSHVPFGGYYPYMPYPPPYAYPAGSKGPPYPYAYAGLPGYPPYPYPPYAYGSIPPYHYTAPPSSPATFPYPANHTYLQPLPPPKGTSASIKSGSEGSSIKSSSEGDQGREASSEPDAKVGESSEQTGTTEGESSASPSIAATPEIPSGKFSFAPPMVSHPVIAQGEVPRRTRDVFTLYTPENLQNGETRKRRVHPILPPNAANAEERLKDIRASLEKSKDKGMFVTTSDEVPSSSSSTGKSRGSFRYMIYQPPEEPENSSSRASTSAAASRPPSVIQSEPRVIQYKVPDAQVVMEDPAEASEDELSIQASMPRKCKNTTCRRTIPSEAPGFLCSKCKTKIRHRQMKTKQRHKLEPLKAVVPTKSLLVASAPGS